jgi:hypothetical protein
VPQHLAPTPARSISSGSIARRASSDPEARAPQHPREDANGRHLRIRGAAEKTLAEAHERSPAKPQTRVELRTPTRPSIARPPSSEPGAPATESPAGNALYMPCTQGAAEITSWSAARAYRGLASLLCLRQPAGGHFFARSRRRDPGTVARRATHRSARSACARAGGCDPRESTQHGAQASIAAAP